mgnify:CR=1 FL=1
MRRAKSTAFPMLEIEEYGQEKRFVVQSVAILRYLGKLALLYPEDPLHALEVESLVELIGAIQSLLEITWDRTVQSLTSGSAWNENEVWSTRRRIAKKTARIASTVLATALEGSVWKAW